MYYKWNNVLLHVYTITIIKTSDQYACILCLVYCLLFYALNKPCTYEFYMHACTMRLCYLCPLLTMLPMSYVWYALYHRCPLHGDISKGNYRFSHLLLHHNAHMFILRGQNKYLHNKIFCI